MVTAHTETRAGNLPAWFKPEEFADPDFDAAAYVANLQGYVPLPVLEQELQAHLDALHNDMIEVINKDYDGFVRLATRLNGLPGTLKRIRAPLTAVQEAAAAARADARGEAAALAERLAAREAVAASRSALELAQELAAALARVDGLLAELGHSMAFTGAATPAPEAVDAECAALNRVTAEVVRLQHYATRGKDMALVQGLAPRDRLDLALAAAILQQLPAALGACLNAYASIGRPGAAVAVVQRVLTAPAVEAAAVRAGAGEGALPAFFDALGEGMRAELGPFLSHALSPLTGGRDFDFLGAGVLAGVRAAVAARYAADLRPTSHAAFRAGHAAGLRFVRALEDYAASADQIRVLRAGEAHAAFARLWNLPAAYSLAFQDIAGALERELGESTLAATALVAPGSPQFHLAATAAAWQALSRTVSPDVFMPCLGERLFRLGLMVLARYASWVREAAVSGGAGPAGTTEPAEPVGAAVRSAGGTTSPSAKDASFAAAVPTQEQLVALLSDAALLGSVTCNDWAPSFAATLSGGDGNGGATQHRSGDIDSAAASSAIKTAAARGAAAAAATLHAAAEPVRQELANALGRACCEALGQLRGVVSTFRMANRRAPTVASPYAIALLAPVRGFDSGAARAGLPGAEVAAVAARAAGIVAAAYADLAAEALESVQRTESSLRRLKSRQRMATSGVGAAGAGAAPAPDTNALIAQQLTLDLETFVKQAAALGLNAEEMEGVQRLRATIAAFVEEKEG